MSASLTDPLGDRPLSERDPVGFRIQQVREIYTKRLVKAMKDGLAGRIPKEKVGSYQIGVKIALAFLDRTDPAPPSNQVLNLNGPVMLGWQTPPPTPGSSSPPRPLSLPSSKPSDASTSSSATADSGKPFWQ